MTRTPARTEGNPAKGNIRNSAPRPTPQQRALRMGERALPNLMHYWIELASGKHPDATHEVRLAAGRMIAAKCGLPDRTETAVPPTLPTKSFELRGWRSSDGKFHEADPAELAVFGMMMKGRGGLS